MAVITLFFSITILYSMLVLFSACMTGMVSLPLKKESRIKCDFPAVPKDKIFIIEAVIFGVSLYLNLLLGILTADGDSAFFVSVIRHFTESDAPFAGYYANGGIVYPPLFNYIYYVLAQILQLCGIPADYTSEAFILAVKLPGILCEFLMMWMLYRYAERNLADGQTIPVLLLTLLNPAYLFVTAYICQIDALYVFFMLLTMMLIHSGRLKTSYFTFAAAVLCKFQTIFITPVLICATVSRVFLSGFSWKKFLTHLGAALAAVGCMVLSYLPFVWDFSSMAFYKGGITSNFTNSIKSYGWASQNTYNFWTLMGYNFRKESLHFGPLSCTAWGTVFIVLLVALSLVQFWRRRDDRSVYPMIGAVLVSGTVCFATRMMPRYLYPAVPFLIFGLLLRPSFKRLLCVILFTGAFYLLTTFDYVVYPVFAYTPKLLLPRVISIYFIFCFLFLNYTIFTESRRDK